MNLPDNRETNGFGLLRLKSTGFGNGDNDDVQKLPEVRLRLEIYGTALMALVSIEELLILSGQKRNRLLPENMRQLDHARG